MQGANTDGEDPRTAEEVIVVRNPEGQYSVWHHDHGAVPQGWEDVGVGGSLDVCLEHIARVWPDPLPAAARRPQPALPAAAPVAS